MRTSLRVLIAAVIGASMCLPAGAWQAPAREELGAPDGLVLADAQRLFYNGRYDAAAGLALALQSPAVENLALYELRTSALHFQLRDALGDQPDKGKALKQCATCADLLKAFLGDIASGQALARDRLRTDPGDEDALVFLGKIDLNYVWLQLETLGRRTGWKEYWEARKSLDLALKGNPQHVRARMARAWIDYIVDTKMPRGTRWVLGGGSRKRALIAAREARAAEAEPFVHVEAEFGLWDMLVREKNLTEAIPMARKLASDFPENRTLVTFLKANDPTVQP
jgi:hypothetical protein